MTTVWYWLVLVTVFLVGWATTESRAAVMTKRSNSIVLRET
jgi:hypothetical protein